jgi:hypothetical protein
MSALVALRAEEWISKLSVKWLMGFYSANVLLAVGISVAAGLWLVLAFTIAAIAITAILASVLSASSQAADSGTGSLLRLMKP